MCMQILGIAEKVTKAWIPLVGNLRLRYIKHTICILSNELTIVSSLL